MILDNLDEIDSVFEYIQDKKTLLVPITINPTVHSSINQICCIYIYTEDDVEYIIPFRHTEQIQSFTEHIQRFLSLSDIFVYDKKQWLQLGGNANVFDIKTLWWYTYNEPYDETHYFTPAHKFYWRRHPSLSYVNTIIPLQQHLAMCQKIRKYAWPMCMNAKLDESYLKFNKMYPSVYAAGALFEMDFDAYHVRLIAKLIGYNLPNGSIHEYFGKFYFDTDTLTEEQYEQSKQITFRLLYGGIDKEFLEIPFFKQVNAFVYSLWDTCKKRNYVETPILKRKIHKDSITNITANKLFNYYLQALETEVSTPKLQQVLEYLIPYNSKLILYTYDSILLDVDYSEAKQILPELINIMQRGNFPVKCKVGGIYSKMNSITL